VPATTESRRAVAQSLVSGERWQWPSSLGPDPEFDRDDTDSLVIDAQRFAWAWFKREEHTDVDELVAEMRLDYFDWSDHVDVALWHRNTKGVERWVKAHILREIKGWDGESQLVEYLERKPFLASRLGFYGVPNQSDLWKWRHGKFSDELEETIGRMAAEIVAVARERKIPCPDEVFRPDRGDTSSEEPNEKSVRDLTIEKTEEVWQHAKPFVCNSYWLNRGDNVQVPESAWWEAHAFMGSRREMCAESGLDSFKVDSTRDRVHTGSNHRHHLQKITAEDSRQMLRDTAERLIEEARRDSELVGKLYAAIDITKSNPWSNKSTLDRDENDNVSEDWILGYKDKDDPENKAPEYYFQWASIQIVGFDIPLVLDAVPVKRGMPRWKIVDELLRYTTDMVDIELLMMDREFAHDGIKEVCEEYGVYYLNPGKMNASERGKCSDLRNAGKLIHIEEQESIDDKTTSRKRMYLPAINSELFKNGQPDGETTDDGDGEDGRDASIRETMQAELEALAGKESDQDDAGDERELFSGIIEEVEEEENIRGSDEDKRAYALFETNHPMVSNTDDDGNRYSTTEKIHMVERMVRRYSQRWGIENGFKQIKNFRVRTTSKDHEYRFFNFAYACPLYNVWRLVDLLVKLSLEDDPEYEPLVTADLFLTIAKNQVGLDPPD